MKLRIPLAALQHALLLSGVSLLGYCAYALADAWWFQREMRREMRQEVRLEPETVTPEIIAPVARVPIRPAVRTEGVVGHLEVERLGLSVMVMEGTTATTLRRAVGHIAGTALPGEPGNVGISGHRDTFFLPLRNIRQDDEVRLTTRTGKFRYRVVSVTVVLPTDTDVLDGTEAEVLTLVTCYPFAFIGRAPERYVVRALRVL